MKQKSIGMMILLLFFLGITAISISRPIQAASITDFNIKEDDDEHFWKMLPDDNEKSLFLRSGETEYALSISYGLSTDSNCSWESSNKEVVTVDKGKVTVVGAGKADICVTYQLDGSAGTLTDEVTVYVLPTVTSALGVQTLINIHSGKESDRMSINTVSSSGAYTIADKVEWVITRDIGGVSDTLADSIDKSSDLIHIDADNTNQKLKVDGKTGIYNVYFFPKGVYSAYKSKEISLEDIPSDVYQKTTIKIYAEAGDRDACLVSGDSFDLPSMFNMTTDMFNECFSVELIDGSNVVSYIESSCIGTIKRYGNAIMRIKINDAEVLQQYLDGVLPGSGYYTCEICAIEAPLSFNMSSVTIAQGASMYLGCGVDITGLKYTSSDQNYVTVDKNGLITAVQVTPDHTDCTITASIKDENGLERRATCFVRVVKTVTEITLPGTDMSVNVDKTATITCTFTPNISTAPIMWSQEDESICSLNVNPDKKSAVITGKKAGKTQIILRNQDNFIVASMQVEVRAPIETLQPMEVTAYLSKMTAIVSSCESADVESRILQGSVADETIATIDGTNVTGQKVGTTRFTQLAPVYNPYCTELNDVPLMVVNPIQKIELLNADCEYELSDGSCKLQTSILPSDAMPSDLVWSSSDPSVATVGQDGTVTFVDDGTASITVEPLYNCYQTKAVCNITINDNQVSLSLDKENDTSATTSISKLASLFLQLHLSETMKTCQLKEKSCKLKVDSFYMGRDLQEEDIIWQWTSSNPDVATVNEDGTVTFKKAGTTVIEVTATDSSDVFHLKDKCVLMVTNPIQTISLDSSEKECKLTDTECSLSTVCTPIDATMADLVWSSTNPSVATVDQTGKVTFLAEGTTKICVEPVYNPMFVSDSCEITVTKEPPATPTPVATPVATPIGTLTPTPAATPTGTLTPTEMPSAAPTATVTPTVKPTSTVIPTPASTPITTASPTEKPSAAPIATVTPKPTVTLTPTEKPSADPVVTAVTNQQNLIYTGKEPVVSSLIHPVKAKKHSIVLSWSAVKGADGYMIYSSKCNANNQFKKTADVNKTKYCHAGRKSGTWYKYLIVAYKNVNGQKIAIGQSLDLYAITKESKNYTNPIKIKTSVKKIVLKVGKKAKVKAKVVLPKKKKTKFFVAKLRYLSSNKKIVSVNKKGKITAKTKGVCNIYVVTQNGVSKKIRVVVKG